jgi:hypothetical protein
VLSLAAHAELRPHHFRDGWIHHPLVVEPFLDPDRAALVNYVYCFKKEAADTALKEGDYDTYVFTHSRGYRFDAFKRIAPLIDAPAAYWQLVTSVWTDSEKTHELGRFGRR